MIVDNKPGGGTIIGTEIVAKAKPDGYTILLTPGALAVNAAFGINLPYDIDQGPRAGRPLRRSCPCCWRPATTRRSSRSPSCWPGRRPPGRTIPYASAGVGSIPHLWGEYLKARTGMPLEHVGYKGSAEALRDVMAGHVPLFSDVLMPTATPVKAGKLRGLAVAMAERSALLPDVPTVGEAGLAGMEGAVPFGISTTGGTPLRWSSG